MAIYATIWYGLHVAIAVYSVQYFSVSLRQSSGLSIYSMRIRCMWLYTCMAGGGIPFPSGGIYICILRLLPVATGQQSVDYVTVICMYHLIHVLLHVHT